MNDIHLKRSINSIAWLAVKILIAVLLAIWFILYLFRREYKTYSENTDKIERIDSTRIDYPNYCLDYQQAEIQLIYSLLKVKQDRKFNQWKISFRVKYIVASLFPFLTGITIILSFYVGQKGWKNCSDRLKTLFILFAFLTGTAGIYPEVFNKNDALAINRKMISDYEKLKTEVANFCSTCENSDRKPVTFEEFVAQVNRKMYLLAEFSADVINKQANIDTLLY